MSTRGDNGMKKINYFYASVILAGAAARLIPHAPNFTPTGAIAFFSGAKIPSKTAYLLPLGIVALSDLFLGWHNLMLFVYLSFLASVFLGRVFNRHMGHQIIGLALSSLIFFIVTNFGVWATTAMYPKTLSGLALCYTAALPFLRNELAANLLFGMAFFGLSRVIEAKLAQNQAVRQPGVV